MAGCLFPQQITEKGNRIWVILPGFWNGSSDADLGSICGFLDVQCMCGSRTSSFLWKYYCDVGDCAVSSWNFHPEAKKNRKNVSGIGEDDQ